MLKLAVLFALVSSCVIIHGGGMILGVRLFSRSKPVRKDHFNLSAMFRILIFIVFGLLLLHLLQILVWAACYMWIGCFPDFDTAFYYSATSYSTVGYGDVIPPEDWRTMGSIEAVTGVLMFGWSTGVLFSVVNHLQNRYTEQKRMGPRTE